MNRLEKTKFILPSMVTSVNLIFGLVSIFLCLHAKSDPGLSHLFVLAAWLTIACTMIDGLDGKVARLTRTSSEFGIQYDSIADVVAFGVAPAVLMYARFFGEFEKGFALLPIVFLLSSAFRLARFNVTTDGKKKKCFYGLPTPPSGGIIAAYVLCMDFASKYNLAMGSERQAGLLLAAIVIMNCVLMVSKIEFDVFYRFFYRNFGLGIRGLITVIILIGIIKFSGPVLIGLGFLYIIQAVGRWAILGFRQRNEPKDTEEEAKNALG